MIRLGKGADMLCVEKWKCENGEVRFVSEELLHKLSLERGRKARGRQSELLAQCLFEEISTTRGKIKEEKISVDVNLVSAGIWKRKMFLLVNKQL
jgi:hypothetical protein